MVVYDLLIIGGGYWGCGVAIAARESGLSVRLVDDGDLRSGSRNASAIADLKAYRSPVFSKYLPPDWTRTDLQDSFTWLVDHGGVVTREHFWNHFTGKGPRLGNESVYLPAPDTLAKQSDAIRVPGKVVGGTIEDKVEVKLLVGSVLRGRYLVVAAGYRTDEVLACLNLPSVGVGRLYGRGINLF